MTQTKNNLTRGAINLAVEVIRRGSLPVGAGKRISKVSFEILVLVELDIARVNGHHLVRHDGSERILGETLRAQLKQNSETPLSGD